MTYEGPVFVSKEEQQVDWTYFKDDDGAAAVTSAHK
jgi:hypothetical protein